MNNDDDDDNDHDGEDNDDNTISTRTQTLPRAVFVNSRAVVALCIHRLKCSSDPHPEAEAAGEAMQEVVCAEEEKQVLRVALDVVHLVRGTRERSN